MVSRSQVSKLFLSLAISNPEVPSIQSETFKMFTNLHDYESFSCVSPGGQAETANNIESIHNTIHYSVGGYGHMTYPEVAAFDPVFWFHHANVDRLFAMWQTLNPDTYIEPTRNTYGSYYEPVGFMDSGSTGQCNANCTRRTI